MKPIRYKYSVEENELLHTLMHHKKSCRTLTFNDSGSLLFSASKDKSIVVTDMATMKPTHSILKSHSYVYKLNANPSSVPVKCPLASLYLFRYQTL